MEGVDPVPQSADPASKKRATPTNSPPRPSPTNGPGHKRQRLDSKNPVEERCSTADFISLDFSDGDGEEEELEAIEKISKSASLDSIVEENEDAEEEGGLKEKTSKRKRRAKGRGNKRLKESDPQTDQEVKDQSEQSNLAGEGNSSDEGGSAKITPTNGSIGSEDVDNESEEEDKDSFTRRALQAKIANSTQALKEGQNEQNPKIVENVETVETAVAAAAKSETDNTSSSNSTTLPVEEDLKAGKVAVEDGIEVDARNKSKDKEKKHKGRGKQWKELKVAKKERRNKAQIDLSKGGDFSNLPGNGEMVGFSDIDDEGIEINVDMDMDDLKVQQEEQQGEEQAEVQTKNGSDDEEGEVDESPENGDVASEDESESSSDGHESPLLNQISALKQRKYYTAFILPPFEQVEARPYFTGVETPDFKLDITRERKLAVPHRIKDSKRICNICTKTGHSEDKCEYLKCKHCEKWNEHFSHACPDAPADDEPRIKDKWRFIPTHFHKTNSPPLKLHIACYHCAGIDHFGDDCPHIPPLPIPGSFSLTDINTCGYASQDWLLTFSDKLDDLASGKAKVKYGPAGTKGTVMPAPDPFKDYRKLDKTPLQPPPPIAPRGRGRNGGGTKGEDMYRPDRAPRGPGRASQGDQYHIRRSDVFDRYRGPPPPTRQSHGLPPKPRSGSPSKFRPGGGGGGGGGGGPRGGNPYRPPSDLYDRPSQSGNRGGYGGAPGRAYDSRAQPPLPNEPVPRSGGSRNGGGRTSFKLAPSSARGSWQKYKT